MKATSMAARCMAGRSIGAWMVALLAAVCASGCKSETGVVIELYADPAIDSAQLDEPVTIMIAAEDPVYAANPLPDQLPQIGSKRYIRFLSPADALDGMTLRDVVEDPGIRVYLPLPAGHQKLVAFVVGRVSGDVLTEMPAFVQAEITAPQTGVGTLAMTLAAPENGSRARGWHPPEQPDRACFIWTDRLANAVAMISDSHEDPDCDGTVPSGDASIDCDPLQLRPLEVDSKFVDLDQDGSNDLLVDPVNSTCNFCPGSDAGCDCDRNDPFVYPGSEYGCRTTSLDPDCDSSTAPPVQAAATPCLLTLGGGVCELSLRACDGTCAEPTEPNPVEIDCPQGPENIDCSNLGGTECSSTLFVESTLYSQSIVLTDVTGVNPIIVDFGLLNTDPSVPWDPDRACFVTMWHIDGTGTMGVRLIDGVFRRQFDPCSALAFRVEAGADSRHIFVAVQQTGNDGELMDSVRATRFVISESGQLSVAEPP